MQTRLIQPSDYLALRDLDALLTHDLPGWQLPGALFGPDEFARYCVQGCSYLALRGDTALGYLLAQPIAFDSEAVLTIWVDALAVHPAQRRRGIALALYRALGSQAHTSNLKGILTRLPAGDMAALALHRRVGFEPHLDDEFLWRVEESA